MILSGHLEEGRRRKLQRQVPRRMPVAGVAKVALGGHRHEASRRHDNAVRCHSSLNYMTAHEFKLHNSPTVLLTGAGSKKPSRLGD